MSKAYSEHCQTFKMSILRKQLPAENRWLFSQSAASENTSE